MADLSFDCDAPNLLCTETNNTDDLTHQTDNQNLESNNVRSDTLMGLFTFQIEEVVCLMFEREREHLPKDDYLYRLRSGNLDLSVRREALGWIWKVGWLIQKWGVWYCLVLFIKCCICINFHYFLRHYIRFVQMVLRFYSILIGIVVCFNSWHSLNPLLVSF